MKKFLVMATAGIFLLNLQGPVRAQKEVQPPPVPPMLEGPRPLSQPDIKEPAAPQKLEEEKPKAKGKAKAGQKASQKKASLKKQGQKKAQTAGKKKGQKTSKKKRPAAEPKPPGPDEG